MSSDAHLGDAVELGPLTDVPTDRYEVFRHPQRLRLLEILDDDRRRPLSALTTELLEREGRDVSNGRQRQDVYTGLVHNHLPRLAAADIVDWDVDTGATLTDGLPICPSALTAVLESDHDLEDRIDVVVDPVRLTLLQLLADRENPLSVDSLASTLATRESAISSDTERAKLVLHHTHLPALEHVGLLEYDREARLVDWQDGTISF